MSIDPEDSSFEQALRDDLPSTKAEARMRRRLLAAGVAVGQGIATTTAAASAAGASAAGPGFFAQALGLSWGIKLGAIAAVAIPTLGLLVEGRSAPAPVAAVRVAVASISAKAPSGALPHQAVVLTPAAPATVATTPSVTVAAERAALRREATLPPPLADDSARPAAPSQSDFAAMPAGPAAAPAAKSTLADETRLLDGAFAALAAGDRARAAERIGEHEARYPRGLLSEERERAKIRLSELSRGK